MLFSMPLRLTLFHMNFREMDFKQSVKVPQNFWTVKKRNFSQSGIEYLHDYQNVPIFKTAENINIKEIFHLLTLNIDKNQHYIYKNVPCWVNRSSNFMVDLSRLSSVEDLKCNDGKAMEHIGQTLRKIRFDKNRYLTIDPTS